MSSKAKLLMKGSILRMIEFFVTAFITLAMTPFVIYSLGDKMYGLWIFVGSFMGYYGLMDFGLNTAVQRFLSHAIGLKDNPEANKVINTAFYVFAFLGIIVLIISIMLAYFMPILIKNISDVYTFRVVVLILGINFAIGFPMRIFYGILNSYLRYEVSTIIELIKVVIRALFIIIFLKNGYGVIALAVITSVFDISGFAIRYFSIKALFPFIIFSKAYFDKKKIKQLFEYSIYTFIAQIADQLRFNVDNLVITIFIGLNPVTLYSIASRLIKYFMQFMASAIGIVMPLFSQYEAKGDYDSIRDKFILMSKISCYLSVLIGGLLIIFGKVFIERWVGIKYLNAYTILLILLFPFIFDVMQIPGNNLLYGLSKHKYYSISNSIEGVINLILSIVLVKRYGLYGVAIGTAIPMIVIKLLVQPLYTCKVIGMSWKKFYISLMIPAFFSAVGIVFLYWLIIRHLISPSYLSIICLILVGVVFFGLAIFKIGLGTQEKNYFKNIFLSILAIKTC